MGKNKVYMVSDDDSTYAHRLTLREAVRMARAYRDSDECYAGRIRVAKAVPGAEEDVEVDLDDPVFMTKTELRERLGKALTSAEQAQQASQAARKRLAQERAQAVNRMIEAGFIPLDLLTRFLVDIRTEVRADPESNVTCDSRVVSMGMMEHLVELHMRPYPVDTGGEPDPFAHMLNILVDRTRR